MHFPLKSTRLHQPTSRLISESKRCRKGISLEVGDTPGQTLTGCATGSTRRYSSTTPPYASGQCRGKMCDAALCVGPSQTSIVILKHLLGHSLLPCRGCSASLADVWGDELYPFQVTRCSWCIRK